MLSLRERAINILFKQDTHPPSVVCIALGVAYEAGYRLLDQGVKLRIIIRGMNGRGLNARYPILEHVVADFIFIVPLLHRAVCRLGLAVKLQLDLIMLLRCATFVTLLLAIVIRFAGGPRTNTTFMPVRLSVPAPPNINLSGRTYLRDHTEGSTDGSYAKPLGQGEAIILLQLRPMWRAGVPFDLETWCTLRTQLRRTGRGRKIWSLAKRIKIRAPCVYISVMRGREDFPGIFSSLKRELAFCCCPWGFEHAHIMMKRNALLIAWLDTGSLLLRAHAQVTTAVSALPQGEPFSKPLVDN